MNLEAVLETARTGRLYPSVILYGLGSAGRQQAAVDIARTLLCASPPEARPCVVAPPKGGKGKKGLEAGKGPTAEPCNHCRRIDWSSEQFHPDFRILERDLRTATSAGATKSFLAPAYSAPFEARGQVFVIAEAESLSGGAADALLKLLEEPPGTSPRHFLLLAASRLDLSQTLRSRSLALYLGPSDSLGEEEVDEVAAAFGRSIDRYAAGPSPIHLLTASEALTKAAGWEDPRARRPWATAAAAIARYLETAKIETSLRRPLLALALDLLDAPQWRMRGITHGRILEGLLVRHLTRP